MLAWTAPVFFIQLLLASLSSYYLYYFYYEFLKIIWRKTNFFFFFCKTFFEDHKVFLPALKVVFSAVAVFKP